MECPTQNHIRPEITVLCISQYDGGIFGKAKAVSTIYVAFRHHVGCVNLQSTLYMRQIRFLLQMTAEYLQIGFHGILDLESRTNQTGNVRVTYQWRAFA